jgi:hypothetical protein
VPQACTRYRPRTTQDSAIVRVLREHLDELLEKVEADADRRLPAFVVKQLRAISSCGDFLRGSARFECSSCRSPPLLILSGGMNSRCLRRRRGWG